MFDINWEVFVEDDEKENVLYYVDWQSCEVSTTVDVQCFTVNVNADLEHQFKRLQNNTHFGGFCCRLIAEQILSELIHQTLRFCKIENGEPQIDSPHHKFKALLEKLGYDFDNLARMMQSTSPLYQFQAGADIRKIMQKMNKVGSNLQVIKFGGYR